MAVQQYVAAGEFAAMTKTQFNAALQTLGLNHMRAAATLGVGRNTVIRYAHGHTPVAESVARLIDMLTRYGIPKEYAQ